MKGLIVGAFCLLSAVTAPVNEFTSEEAQLMMRTAQAESGNQGEDGMWLTLSVITNRVNSDDYSTVSEVLYAKGQFATVESGAINTVEISPECRAAYARIEKGEVAPQIIAFERIDSHALEKNFWKAFEYRDHVFYTKKEVD